jgi:hypothetical protein
MVERGKVAISFFLLRRLERFKSRAGGEFTEKQSLDVK